MNIKKTIKVIAISLFSMFILVGIAGFIKFNILQDDIYITQKDGNIVRYIDLEQYVFTTQNGITGIFAYTSKDKNKASLNIANEFYQLKRATSASGSKYTNEDRSVIFWEHQDEVRIEANGLTYLASNLERAEVFTFTIGPEKVDCVGVGPRKCLIVNGEYFYSDIRGFEPKNGVEYEIIVARIERKNVPADASKYIYHLVEVLTIDKKGAPNNFNTNTLTSQQWA